MGDYIFISGNVPSLKNNRIWTGRYFVHSKGVANYLKAHNIKDFSSSQKTITHYKTGVNTFEIEILKLKEILADLTPPYKFQFHFVRKSKHKFDFNNANSLLADLFTSYNLIEDDNMDIFHPSILYIDGKGYSYDKENPGVFINILKIKRINYGMGLRI